MNKTRIAILISGRGSNMAALIYAARADDCPFEVALVTSDRANAPGLDLAAAEGVTVKRIDFDKDAYFHKLDTLLSDHAIDVIALAGFMRILPADFVARWAGRIVNIHPSLLPNHRGLETHSAVLTAGETITGCTVHLVTAELDDGPILGQVEVAVLPADTPETLATRVLIAEHQLYPRTLADFVTRERDLDQFRFRPDADIVTLAMNGPDMFDFPHWADWASHASVTLRGEGLQATYVFAEESKASTNPAFFIDLDKNRNLGRIIVWSTGEFDISVHLHLSAEAHPMADLPKQATDQNFKVIFDRFVSEVADG